jgi:hypothetical protein
MGYSKKAAGGGPEGNSDQGLSFLIPLDFCPLVFKNKIYA